MRSRAVTALTPFRAQAVGWRRPPLSQYHFQQRRPQSQSVTLKDGTQIRRQDVVFTRPRFFSVRRFGTIIAYTLGVYYTIKYVPRLAGFDIQVALDVAEEYDDDEDDEDDDEDEDEDEDEGSENGKKLRKRLRKDVELTEEDLDVAEDSLFIPMTWAQAMPRQYYKGTDPEWQEFVKISTDTARQKVIWQLMISSFLMFANETNMIKMRLGGDVKPGKHWLDMTFPDGPPVEYVRHGVEFGDGYVAWSRQRIEAEKQHRIARALWPSALLSSAYASARMYTMISWKQLTSYLGFETINKDGTSFGQAFQQAATDFAKNKLSKVHTGTEGSAAGSAPPANASETASKALWPLPAVSVPTSGEGDVDAGSKLTHAMAASAFARTLMKKWQFKDNVPPRGTFFVHGLIEVRGSKGRMLFDVNGVYDPKQNKYIHMQANVKHFKSWKQAPKGKA